MIILAVGILFPSPGLILEPGESHLLQVGTQGSRSNKTNKFNTILREDQEDLMNFGL